MFLNPSVDPSLTYGLGEFPGLERALIEWNDFGRGLCTMCANLQHLNDCCSVYVKQLVAVYRTYV